MCLIRRDAMKEENIPERNIGSVSGSIAPPIANESLMAPSLSQASLPQSVGNGAESQCAQSCAQYAMSDIAQKIASTAIANATRFHAKNNNIKITAAGMQPTAKNLATAIFPSNNV